jgi:hypothetical protein
MQKLQMALLCILLLFIAAFQGLEDPKKLLIKKWKLNEPEMRRVLKDKIKEMITQQGGTLTEEEVESEVNTAWERIKVMTIEFKAEGTFESLTPQGEQKGKWTLSADNQQLTTQREGAPARNFKIIKITKDELVLDTGQQQIPVLAMIPN